MSWLTDWQYRKSITLSRASGAVTNYQMPLLVGESEFSISNVTGLRKHTSNPVLAVRAGKWDSNSVRDLAPVIDESGYLVMESGKIIALYMGYNGTSYQVGRATSTDNGITWGDRLDSPVIALGGAGSWYQNLVQSGSVLKRSSDGLYIAFCAGHDTSDVPRIGVFTSGDLGLTWADGGYKLQVGDFTHPLGAITQMGVACVIKRETDYFMVLEACDSTSAWRVFAATASDPTGTWTAFNSGNPILTPGTSGQWDDFAVANPKILKVGTDQYILSYNGKRSATNWKIGLARATTDFTSWTRNSANPLISGEGSGWEQVHAECSALVKSTAGFIFWYQGFDSGFVKAQIGLVEHIKFINCGCQADFDDLRFTTSDGTTLLDYWIESIAGTTPNGIATVWVEFDSIGTNETTFYMYYGKADAPAVSNGANTFIVFDDFERGIDGDTVGGSWTEVVAHCHISTEQDIGNVTSFTGTRSQKMVGAAGSPNSTIPVTATTNISIRFRIYKENAALIDIYHGDGVTLAAFEYQADEDIVYYDGAGWIDTLSNITPDTWDLVEYNEFDWTAKTCDIWHNNTKIKDNADISLASALYTNKVGLFLGPGIGNDVWIDDFIVRNWRSVEPVWGSWGSEEEEFPSSGTSFVAWIN